MPILARSNTGLSSLMKQIYLTLSGIAIKKVEKKAIDTKKYVRKARLVSVNEEDEY